MSIRVKTFELGNNDCVGDGFVVNLESIKTWKRPRWLSINNLSSYSAAVVSGRWSSSALQQKGQSAVGDGCSIFNCPKRTISIQTSDDGPTKVVIRCRCFIHRGRVGGERSQSMIMI